MLEGVFIKRRKVYELNGILCTFTVFGSLFYLLSHEREVVALNCKYLFVRA